ncbi:MAG: class I SAM-dependent methyltransferase, partial [Stackebrandtia sp.]
RRQVDAFLRAAEPLLPDGDGPLSVADLGCGNAYLTFAMYRYLASRGRRARVVGVDVRDDQRRRNTELARRLECAEDVRFVAATAADAPLENVDVVLALHACDTATDDALARGVTLRARSILAAPCCHHDVAAQLRRAETPTPYRALTADGILREHFADVLTDALRASLLELHGYRVDVIEFVDSAHTPRNTLLRATYTGAAADPRRREEYESLTRQWQVTPHLQRLLEP